MATDLELIGNVRQASSRPGELWRRRRSVPLCLFAFQAAGGRREAICGGLTGVFASLAFTSRFLSPWRRQRLPVFALMRRSNVNRRRHRSKQRSRRSGILLHPSWPRLRRAQARSTDGDPHWSSVKYRFQVVRSEHDDDQIHRQM